jgi:hypothetical protein
MKQNKQTESKIKTLFTAKQTIENEESGNLESVKASNLENEKLVNLGVKIPAAHRNYWNSKAAAGGESMKSIIVELLTERLGKPE